MRWTSSGFFLLALVVSVSAWDDDDLEVFDAVEEVNQNFYQFLGLAQDATSSEIRASYRNLTLKLHPDKNDSPDADEQFRNLISIYNILKDSKKREKYDDVLKNGLPNWKSAIYYYRRVRKMGLAEMSIILCIIITIGQYAVAWASYAEQRYFADQQKPKKKEKKNVRSVAENEETIHIPTPSFKNTLPFQVLRLLFAIITGVPRLIISIPTFIAEIKKKKLEEQERLKKEEERIRREEEEAIKEKEARALRRRRHGFKPPERTQDDEMGCLLDPVDEPEKPVQKPPPVITGGLWTDDDLADLVKLVKKYPSGTSGRWEKIAEMMGRHVAEVTHMAAKLKENCYKVPGCENTTEEIPGLEVPKKVKTKGGRVLNTTTNSNVESSWTQVQQKALENALAKYPRGGVADRWEKIAKCVPDKTKEECMLRYKYLAELLKKQKSEENNEESENQSNQPESKIEDATVEEESVEDA